METNANIRLGSRFGQGSSGRRNSFLVAFLAAIVAGALIYLFVTHYNKSGAAVTDTTVFVAKSYIPAGMSEAQIVSENLLKPEQIPTSSVVVGAISDPSVVTGTVTASPIAAGQQLTLSDFAHGTSSINSTLRGDQRAVAISIDPQHGLTSYLSPGDTVDVATQGSNGTGVLFQDVQVLANANGDVVLNLTDKQALLLADAIQLNLTIWLEMRPATGATNSVKLGTVEKLQ